MLRIFRQLRKTLMEPTKVRTYLLYAVGEILLVVIGILVALQVNNWSEQRKLENSAIAHLSVLKSNLREDLTQLQAIDQNLDETLRSMHSIMDRFQGHKASGDSILYEIIQISLEYSFEPNDNGINILVSSGELGVLSESMQNQISYYYNTVEDIQERDQISNTFIKNQYEDYIFRNYSFAFSKRNPHYVLSYLDTDPRDPVSYDPEAILNDRRLEALIIGRRFQAERQISFYKKGIDEIQTLVKMIDETSPR